MSVTRPAMYHCEARTERTVQFGGSRTWGSLAWLFLVLLTQLSVSARADEGANSPLTLRELIETAQRDNKDLQAARYAIEIGRARLIQAGVLPNPRLTIGTTSDVTFRNQGAYNTSVGVSQDFPLTGRIARQKDLARVDVALAEAEVERSERTLAGEIAINVYRMLTLDRQIQSRDELVAADQRLADATRSRYKAAEVSELDVNTVSIDLQRLAQERALIEIQRASVLAALNRQLGRPAESPLAIAEALPATDRLLPLHEWQEKALASRTDLRIALMQVDRAQAERALAQAKKWEDWTVALGVQQDRLAVDGAPGQPTDRALVLSLAIPFPLWNNNQGQIAEAIANARQANARIEALRLDISSQIASAHAEATSLQTALKRYEETLLPSGDRNIALAQKGYTGGLTTILEVVQALRQQSDLKSAYVSTLDQYLQALAKLRAAAGDYPLFNTAASFPDARGNP